MTDIIVTTPRACIQQAAEEAALVREAGCGTYFRRFSHRPGTVKKGSRVFYTEAGYVRGFAVVTEVCHLNEMRCEATGRDWEAGWYVFMDATSWHWIKPIPYPGFQGFRYFDALAAGVEIVGLWRDPMPEVTP